MFFLAFRDGCRLVGSFLLVSDLFSDRLVSRNRSTKFVGVDALGLGSVAGVSPEAGGMLEDSRIGETDWGVGIIGDEGGDCRSAGWWTVTETWVSFCVETRFEEEFADWKFIDSSDECREVEVILYLGLTTVNDELCEGGATNVDSVAFGFSGSPEDPWLEFSSSISLIGSIWMSPCRRAYEAWIFILRTLWNTVTPSPDTKNTASIP